MERHPITLNDGETVLIVSRPHWLRVALPLAAIFVLFLVPFFFLWPLFRIGVWGVVLFVSLLLLATGLGLRELYRWRHSIIMLTSARFIAVNQRGLLDRVVNEGSYADVYDVVYRVRGFWPTVAGYGSLVLRLNSGPLEISHVPAPARLQRLINDLRDDLREQGHRRDQDGPSGEEWWEERFSSMDAGERHQFFVAIRRQVGEEVWAGLFRAAPHADDRVARRQATREFLEQ